MDMPLISVIVSAYKAEEYIDKCVESIIHQTYKHLEIILIDDGSPDNCPKICDEWAKKDSRIKVIHKQNGGVSSARNAGIANANGEYIVFVDSDDYIEPKMYERLICAMLNDNSDMAVCGYNHRKNINFEADELITNSEAINYMFDNTAHPAFEGYSCNKLYRKNIVENFELYFDTNIKMCEDTLFNFTYLNKCKKVSIVSYIGYNYFDNENSVTNSRDKSYKYIIFDLTQHFIENADEKNINNILMWSFYWWIGILNDFYQFSGDSNVVKKSTDFVKKYRYALLRCKKLSRINKIQVLLISYFKKIYLSYLMKNR